MVAVTGSAVVDWAVARAWEVAATAQVAVGKDAVAAEKVEVAAVRARVVAVMVKEKMVVAVRARVVEKTSLPRSKRTVVHRCTR